MMDGSCNKCRVNYEGDIERYNLLKDFEEPKKE